MLLAIRIALNPVCCCLLSTPPGRSRERLYDAHFVFPQSSINRRMTSAVASVQSQQTGAGGSLSVILASRSCSDTRPTVYCPAPYLTVLVFHQQLLPLKT